MMATAKTRSAATALVAVAALSLSGIATAAPRHASLGKTGLRLNLHVGYTGAGQFGGWSYPSNFRVGYTGDGPFGGWSYPSS